MIPKLVGLAMPLAFVLACSGSRTEGMDPGRMPESIRADYAVFAQKCSKCHSLARPLSATVSSDEEWANYVARMRRQPGSAIAPEDTPAILRFLHWYSFESKLAPEAGAPAAPPAPAANDGGAP